MAHWLDEAIFGPGGVPRRAQLYSEIVALARTGTYVHDSFRFRNDDGGETAATWITAQDVNITREKGANRVIRLRIQIGQTTTNANSDLTHQYKVRLSRNSGAYADVGAQGATAPVRYFNSTNVTHQEATTEQLAGEYTFLPGVIDEQGNTGDITWAGSTRQETELEFVLEIVDAQVAAGDTLDFRVYRTNDEALSTYAVTPRITMEAAGTTENIAGTSAGTSSDTANAHDATAPVTQQVTGTSAGTSADSGAATNATPSLTESIAGTSAGGSADSAAPSGVTSGPVVIFWPTGGPQGFTLTATATSSTTVDLSWQERTKKRARYEVRRDSMLIETTAKGASAYTDTGATPSATHTYEVRAVAPYWTATAGPEDTVTMPGG